MTKAQADQVELKNEITTQQSIDCQFGLFALSRVAAEISSSLDPVVVTMKRKFPELESRHLDFLKRTIAESQNKAAKLDEILPELLDEYLEGAN